MKLPPDLFYTDTEFASPDVHMLSEQNDAFNYIVHVDYNGNGRVPTLQETELGWILAGHIQQPGQPFRATVTSSLTLAERFDALLHHFWADEEFHTVPKTT
jgi:hypothetical protein